MVAKTALLALIVSFLLSAPPANSEHGGFRATMIRQETAINFTRAARQSHDRLSMLAARLDAAASGLSTQTPLRADGGGYDMEFSIGTPPLRLSAQADTGSNLIWTKCGACASCTPQGSPSYYPTKSSSFSKMPCADSLCSSLRSASVATCTTGGTECDYRYSYGLATDARHYTQGYMARETFTLGSDAVPGIGFGCTTMSEGNYGSGSGLVGLGPGPQSLVSQLDVGAFSYCLTPDPSKASPLLFGSLAAMTGTGVQSTPFLGSNTYYLVNLQGISVGTATTAGAANVPVMFDSGTTLTFLADPVYTEAKTAILSQTALPRVADRGGFEACFQYSDGTLPSMSVVLHFDGADMNLQAPNYFMEVEDGVLCWIVQKSNSMSIIGNIMQMNFQIQYDVENSMLSFQPANCDSL